jgi:hypothetical protein
MTGKMIPARGKNNNERSCIVPKIFGASHGLYMRFSGSKLSNINLFKRSTRRLFLTTAGAFFFCLVSASPLHAIGTINASALNLDLEQSAGSFSKSSPSANADSCLPLLRQVRLSPSGSANISQSQRPAGQKASMPMTLGFLIGVRVALGPKEVVKPGRRVQIGPEIIQRYDTGESYALAIAAYRRCKNIKALKQQ